VHYRFDADAGLAAGFGIGDRVHDTTLGPLALASAAVFTGSAVPT
jgi:hypothetical protein